MGFRKGRWMYPAEMTVTIKIKLKADGVNLEEAKVKLLEKARKRVGKAITGRHLPGVVVDNKLKFEIKEKYRYGKQDYTKCRTTDSFESLFEGYAQGDELQRGYNPNEVDANAGKLPGAV